MIDITRDPKVGDLVELINPNHYQPTGIIALVEVIRDKCFLKLKLVPDSHPWTSTQKRWAACWSKRNCRIIV